MKMTTGLKDGVLCFVLDEDPGFREKCEKDTGHKFPKVLTYQMLDGHLQSWWVRDSRTEQLLKTFVEGREFTFEK